MRPWRRGSTCTVEALADRQQLSVVPSEEDRALEAVFEGGGEVDSCRDDTLPGGPSGRGYFDQNI